MLIEIRANTIFKIILINDSLLLVMYLSSPFEMLIINIIPQKVSPTKRGLTHSTTVLHLHSIHSILTLHRTNIERNSSIHYA